MKNKELIKIPVYVKMKITKFPVLSKLCHINNFWGFYLNYEELKRPRGGGETSGWSSFLS